MLTADDARRIVSASGRRHAVACLDVALATQAAVRQDGFAELAAPERARRVIAVVASVGEVFCVFDSDLLTDAEWEALLAAGFSVTEPSGARCRTVGWYFPGGQAAPPARQAAAEGVAP